MSSDQETPAFAVLITDYRISDCRLPKWHAHLAAGRSDLANQATTASVSGLPITSYRLRPLTREPRSPPIGFRQPTGEGRHFRITNYGLPITAVLHLPNNYTGGADSRPPPSRPLDGFCAQRWNSRVLARRNPRPPRQNRNIGLLRPPCARRPRSARRKLTMRGPWRGRPVCEFRGRPVREPGTTGVPPVDCHPRFLRQARRLSHQ